MKNKLFDENDIILKQRCNIHQIQENNENIFRMIKLINNNQ
jgi:hypothetical protein